MPQEYSIAERERALDLYKYDGLTLEQVSERTKIPVPTLKRWSSSEGWGDERESYRADLRAIESKRRRLRHKLMDTVIETLDPQHVYALARVERLIADAKRRSNEENDGTTAHVDRPRLFMEDLEFIAETLRETDPEGLKVFARNFDVLVDRFKRMLDEGAI